MAVVMLGKSAVPAGLSRSGGRQTQLPQHPDPDYMLYLFIGVWALENGCFATISGGQNTDDKLSCSKLNFE